MNNCIYDLQFGFRANHSTSHALINITEHIRIALDSNKFACGTFIDLQKAFDTVDHSILLEKLKYYGIRGLANNWFRSYLSDRRQFVSINGADSKLLFNKIGVPQGSVFGPLLFILYINDLRFSVSNSIVHHFADDTNLLTISNSINSLNKMINYDLKCLTNWLKANKIALNIKKTEFVIFRKKRNSAVNFPTVKMDGKKLFPSTVIKYLGVHIDEHLSWNNHINQLTVKLSRANGILAKIRHFVSLDILRSIYFAIFESHIRYGCIVWGQKGTSLRSSISVLQNTAIRIISFSDIFAKSKPLYDKLNLIQFTDIVDIDNIIFSHSFVTNNLPSFFSSFFSLTGDSLHATRRSSKPLFKINPINSKKYGSNSIKNLCIKVWNNLVTCHPEINFLVIKKNILLRLLHKLAFLQYQNNDL
jgi:hypothetical protein